jgi:adenylosuccinate lyase
MMDKLIIYPQNMQKNLDKLGGLSNSQRILLLLTQKGVSREDSYKLVQRNAMKVWLEGKDFLKELKADSEVTAKITEKELEEMFDMAYHTKQVDFIFNRVFGVTKKEKLPII